MPNGRVKHIKGTSRRNLPLWLAISVTFAIASASLANQFWGRAAQAQRLEEARLRAQAASDELKAAKLWHDAAVTLYGND